MFTIIVTYKNTYHLESVFDLSNKFSIASIEYDVTTMLLEFKSVSLTHCAANFKILVISAG